MTGAQFWVQYWFEDHEDYEEHRPKITEIFDLLDATPFLHKHTEETDSGDIMRKNLRHVAAFRHPGATRLPQTRS